MADSTTQTFGDLKITITPTGRTNEELMAFAQRAMRQEQLIALLKDTRHALLSAAVVDQSPEGKKDGVLDATHFQAVIQDYTNQRTLRVSAAFANPAQISIEESATQVLNWWETRQPFSSS